MSADFTGIPIIFFYLRGTNDYSLFTITYMIIRSVIRAVFILMQLLIRIFK